VLSFQFSVFSFQPDEQVWAKEEDRGEEVLSFQFSVFSFQPDEQVWAKEGDRDDPRRQKMKIAP
jgi:hypothetical protein